MLLISASIFGQQNFIYINIEKIQGVDSLEVHKKNSEYVMKRVDAIEWTAGKTVVYPVDSDVAREVTFIPISSENHELLTGKSIAVCTYPGEDVVVNGTIEKPETEGKFMKRIEELARIYAPADTILRQASRVYAEKTQNGGDKDEAYEEYIKSSKVYEQKLADLSLQYIAQHPEDEKSVMAMAYVGNRIEEAVKMISPKVTNGPMSFIYNQIVNDARNNILKEKAKTAVVEGIEAPDFTKADQYGNKISLHQLRNRYVILDFWGSWCGWCIKGFPEMKKYYEKYKDKVEILGIACRDKKEKWLNAIDKHQIPWLNVLNEGTPDITVLYGVDAYPTKIVISPDGKILKKVVGEEPSFYTYLDELFGK